MSKLEAQKALPRRSLFAKPTTFEQRFGKDAADAVIAASKKRKAKKAKRK